MPLPDVTVSVDDGSLGFITASSAEVHAVIGTSSKGALNTPAAYSDINALIADFGVGPGPEAAAHSLAVAGGPVYFVRLGESGPGTCGSVTQTGSGPTLTLPTVTVVTATGTAPPTVTLSGTPLLFANIWIDIVVGGALATATFRYSTDGGTTYSTTQATAATFVIPGTGLTIHFADDTYVADNLYKAITCVPNDGYEIEVEILGAGALATATFRYSLDALAPSGPTWSPPLTTPASGQYIIPGTGICITMASGSYVAGTTYVAQCSPPAFGTTEVNAAMVGLLADSRSWGFVHVTGQASSVDNSEAVASALDAKMATAATGFRFAFAVCECHDDTDTNIATNANFLAFSSTRVVVGAGFERVTSAISGRSWKRNVAFDAAARGSLVDIGVDLARVADGPLPGVTSLYRDENVTPNLDSLRFTTARSIVGRTGFYLTNARLMAPAGSDFQYVQYRRVMDRGCQVSRDTLLDFLNDGVRVNTDGTIDERDALRIEGAVEAAMVAALVQPRQVTAVACVVDRTNNVQTTSTLKVQVRIRPLGYAKFIADEIGFSATSAAQALPHGDQVSPHQRRPP